MPFDVRDRRDLGPYDCVVRRSSITQAEHVALPGLWRRSSHAVCLALLLTGSARPVAADATNVHRIWEFLPGARSGASKGP